MCCTIIGREGFTAIDRENSAAKEEPWTARLHVAPCLGGTAAVGLGVAFAGSLEAFGRPDPRVPGGPTGYGPLVTDPLGVVSLPAGFSYVECARSGTPTEAGGPPSPAIPTG